MRNPLLRVSFISRRGVSAVGVERWAGGLSLDQLIVVGDKSFGQHNGHVYAKRHRLDYFEQTVVPLEGERFLRRNRCFAELYCELFVDMMGLLTSEDGKVRVLTPDRRFLSPGGKLLIRVGARWFAERIEWGRYFKLRVESCTIIMGRFVNFEER